MGQDEHTRRWLESLPSQGSCRPWVWNCNIASKVNTIYINSQPAYPPGGVPEAYCHVDVKLTAEVKDDAPPKLPPGCYFFRHCVVCNPPNIAEGCGAGYTQADLNASCLSGSL